MDNRKYEIISFFDKCRWANSENYGTEKYNKDVNTKIVNKLKDKNDRINAKLLTYICTYTMDRQTDYKKVCDECGPIMADIIIEYISPNNKIDDNFQTFYDVKEKMFKGKFGNRTFKDNMKSVYRTLYILQYGGYKKSIINYLRSSLKIKEKKEYDPQELMDEIASKLYYLTYKSIKRDDEAFQNELKDDIENNKIEEKISFDKFGNKRLWCVFRDFLKWRPREEFDYLFEILKIDEELQEEHQTYLELTGDVWNNNDKFGECLFEGEKDEKEKLNKFLREQYTQQENKENYYPEQFDITFDLARNMCNEDKCNICPFNVLKGKISKGKISKEEIEKICIHNENSYCTVALICCGYKVNCEKNCKLLEILNRKGD